MYQTVSVIGVGITTVKQACQNLSLAAPPVFLATSRHCYQHISPRVLTFSVLIFFYFSEVAKCLHNLNSVPTESFQAIPNHGPRCLPF